MKCLKCFTRIFLICVIGMVVMLSSCKEMPQEQASTSETQGKQVAISFDFKRVNSHGTNQFAVWIEKQSGEYVKTLTATKFTADGGYKRRPTSIPAWVEKSDLKDMEKPEIDAITSATPKDGNVKFVWDCTDKSGRQIENGIYRFVIEGTSDFTDNIGRNIIFAGEIEIGDGEQRVVAAIEHEDEFSRNTDMISNVTAVYTP